VLQYSTLRALLAKTAAKDLKVNQLDVNTAFLNPTLKEEIYIEIPQFFELLYPDIDFKGKCLGLLKSLYRLKQAPREWFLEVRNYLRTCGFLASNTDPNLFVGKGVSILLYVNNMLIIRKRNDVDTAKALIRHK
jgi:hypothetical protein